jgi:GntR family transcriptional regulator, transcriptional repressor for pyruvate dehydrogenase complex
MLVHKFARTFPRADLRVRRGPPEYRTQLLSAKHRGGRLPSSSTQDDLLDPQACALNGVETFASTTMAKPASAADMLARRIQDAIAQGEFTLGSPLPSERELMTSFRLSRTTVREALRALGAQGLIEVKRGRNGGSFISSPTSQSITRSLNDFIKGQNIRSGDLIFAREALEPTIAAQAAILRTEADLEVLRLRCVECEGSFGEVTLFAEANVKWHLAVAEASGNPLFIAFLTSILANLHTAEACEECDTKTRKKLIGGGWQIFDAIRLGDPDAAYRRMARHFSIYRKALSTTNSAAALVEAGRTL